MNLNLVSAFGLAIGLSLAFSPAAHATVDEIPSMGIKAVYDPATGIVEITQAGVSAAVTVDVGLTLANSKLIADLDQMGMVLYERNGTAVILKSSPGSLTLFSKTRLPKPSWPGANVINEGFRFIVSPNSKISVAIFRFSYHQQIGGRGVTNYLRTIVSNLTPACVSDLSQLLGAPQIVDQNWVKSSAIVQNLVQQREDECATADFDFSLPQI